MSESFKYVQWEHEGSAIRGSLFTTRERNAPWVILCHGFTGHRIGPNYLFVELGRHFALQGINTIAYDSRGCGESDGEFADITIASLRSDLVSAYRIIKEKYNPPSIHILGHSFGGTVAAWALDRISVDGLILVSPLADIPKHIKSHEYILTQGKNSDGFYEYGPHEMKIDFLNELKSCEPFSALRKSTIKGLLLFQGDADQDIPVEESRMYVDAARKHGIETVYHIVKEADHRFRTVQSRIFLRNTITAWIKELAA